MTEFVIPPTYMGDGRGKFDPSVYLRVAEDVAASYPDPEVSSRDNVTGPTKRAAQDLAKFAEELGWDVQVTYARGCPPHSSHGTPLGVRDSLAIRMHQGIERYAFAVYAGGLTWSWDSMWIWSRNHKPMKYTKIGEFKESLR